ncbi:hypothetical protein [Natrarchaeobaculum aegyptiacum]|uniref:Uncharacterized protein n=1 Tax=Natrarchaeobaculum aegyptiacum TaxID=745377 RepID=A0A2Z2HVH3_9EURY|nr:hypothetical protein [Natrarchaeobaculum aegyptiacum]ARS91289.1 hypothetical protein B1756_17220 [Natrarchaeobaculum aegyptiacum]
MTSIDRLTARRSVIATIGSGIALVAAGYGSARQNNRTDEPATEPARTATPDDPVATDESSDAATAGGDPDATGESTTATDDQAGCGCPD